MLHFGNAGLYHGTFQNSREPLPGETLFLPTPPIEPFECTCSDPSDIAVERENVPVNAIVVVVAPQPDVQTPEEFLTG